MIKRSELFIGAPVKFRTDTGFEKCEVLELHRSTAVISFFNSVMYKDLFPVEVTESWINELSNQLDEEGLRYKFMELGQNFLLLDGFSKMPHGLITTFKYQHELIALFRFLTGKELEIC